MKSRPGEKVKLLSVDELLCVPNSEGATEIEVARIHPFKNHPFKVVDDDKMHELAESIMENGVLTPVIVRPDADGYEMISGHRRLFAVKQVGLETIPAIVRELGDDEAVLAMVDSILQREEILPSEKAFAYKMRYEAMRRKAGRPIKGNSSQVGRNYQTDIVLANQIGESRNQLHRYLRLTELIPDILNLVDTKALALMTAVDISHIDKEVRGWLYEYMRENGACKSFQIIALREYLKENGAITQMGMIKVLNENMPGTSKDRTRVIKIPEKKLCEYFPAFFTRTQMENIIFKLLEEWKNENNGGEADGV